MRFASLGSGSRGNALVVEHDGSTLLIDCGLSFKAVKTGLAGLGLCPGDLDAVFITHEHSDHISGLTSLVRKTDLDVFMTEGTAYASGWHDSPGVSFVRDRNIVDYGEFRIEPVIVPHDAREPCQFVVTAHYESCSNPQRQLGVLTDLGSDSSHIVESYASCDALVLECNHDTEMLHRGPYPPQLKARVSSDWGHLNNDQSATFLNKIDTRNLQWLVLAHISEQNNSVELASDTISQVFPGKQRMLAAKQDGGFDWLTIE